MNQHLTDDQQRGGIYAAALMGLGHHMHQHNLPTPLRVELDSSELRPLTVQVADRHHQEWLNTISILGSTEEPTGALPNHTQTTFDAVLESGTRVQLLVVRMLPAVFSMVDGVPA